MDKQWYYVIEDKTLGPVTKYDLEHIMSRGEISKDTLIWAEGMDSWAPFSSLEESLFKSNHNADSDKDLSEVPQIEAGEDVSCLKMFCSNCGKELDDESVFCENCGSRIVRDLEEDKHIPYDELSSSETHPKQPIVQPSVKKSNLWKWFFGVIIVCIAIGALFYTNRSRDYGSGNSTTVPSFSNYRTDMASILKYASDLNNTSIDACRKSWKQKNADAALCLAARETDEQRFIDLLREASNLGHPIAQNQWALILDQKKPQGDSVEIASLIRASANSGIPHAQVTVGWWHMTGEHGFDIDYAEAMKWNLLAYKQGHSEGANNIGELYEKGLGVPKDLEQAKFWYKKASQLGNAQATERLEKLAENKAEATIKPSFDCKRATIAAERLICSSKALAETDVQMAQAYKAVLARTADKQALKREQLAWLKNERDVCTDEDAMLKVYQERIEQLSTR